MDVAVPLCVTRPALYLNNHSTHTHTLQGLVLERYRVFQGVPYGAPPIGDLRWKHSQPVKPWAPAVLNATVEAAGCPQVWPGH